MAYFGEFSGGVSDPNTTTASAEQYSNQGFVPPTRNVGGATNRAVATTTTKKKGLSSLEVGLIVGLVIAIILAGLGIGLGATGTAHAEEKTQEFDNVETEKLVVGTGDNTTTINGGSIVTTGDVNVGGTLTTSSLDMPTSGLPIDAFEFTVNSDVTAVQNSDISVFRQGKFVFISGTFQLGTTAMNNGQIRTIGTVNSPAPADFDAVAFNAVNPDVDDDTRRSGFTFLETDFGIEFKNLTGGPLDNSDGSFTVNMFYNVA